LQCGAWFDTKTGVFMKIRRHLSGCKETKRLEQLRVHQREEKRSWDDLTPAEK
jgi:hypothetical protein